MLYTEAGVHGLKQSSIELHDLGSQPTHAARTARREGHLEQHVAHDDLVHMERLGKKQQFDRNFQLTSITSFSVVAMGGWIFVPNNATSALIDGNTGGTIALYLVNFGAFFTIMLSLAEMASMAPTAGGQYHWASEFAPKSLQRSLSYAVGWLSALAWCCGTTSGFYLAGSLIQAVIVELHSSYTAAPWRAYLLVLGLATIGALVNTFLSRKLPKLEGVAFVLTIFGFVTVVIVLWVLSSPNRLTAAEVFQTFTNDGGWSSLGLSMMAGQILLVWALTGADATAHMAEETRHASAVIPKAMLYSYIINGLLVFIMLITYCFCVTDLDAAFSSDTGYPFIEVFASATGSPAGAAGLTCVLIVLIVFSVTNYMASCSRQVFSFARDRGIPCSLWLAKVDEKTNCPINAVAVSYGFCVLISLISLGSAVAFNAIISLQLLALITTYWVTIGSLVWRRGWGKPLPRGDFSLGWAGLPVNIFALVYSAYLIVFVAFPTELPVTLDTVNWAPVMFVGVVALALLYYLAYARHVYEGPVALVDLAS
ncbi:hypothetical protein LTR36_000873 [Oleoguttula mirabilis]|uniref:Amino acid transporter n=1 Tax=Oleoguttula mirabilis TaxID=1507867 RepID=A0AAV9J3R3_9PEZI|nr:hypothetical protein LTR36_000873 [Oleoguttula mirabilis]